MNVNLGNGAWVSQASYQKAKTVVANQPTDRKMTSSEVLSSLRDMMPGWNISTNQEPYNGSGIRNIGIHPQLLQKMADDPEEMVRMKASLLDAEKATPELEKWANQSGVQLISSGRIYDADGNVSMWSITKSSMEKHENRSLFELPKNNKQSWAEIMREQFDKARDKKQSKGWTI